MDDLADGINKYWPVGLVIALIGSIAGAVGDNMVRLEYTKAGPHVKPSEMFKRWKWIVGLLMTTVVDLVCTLTALALAPATVVTPFAGVHIFWNIFLAKFWLGEEVGFWEILGSVSVIAGVVLIVVFSGKGARITSIETLREYVMTTPFIVFVATMSALLTAALLFSTDCGARKLPVSVRKQLQRLSVAASSGLFGGCTNISAKSLMIIGMQLFQGDISVLRAWESYIILIATVTLAVSQLVYLNVGLRRYEAIYVVPTINSCLIGSGNVGGVMVLQEYPSNWSGFFVGLVAAVGGILALTITHTSRDWTKITSKMRSSEFVAEIPSESLEWYCPSDSQSHISISDMPYSPSIYRQFGQNIARSVTAISGAQIALNPSALHHIQSMQEIRRPERPDLPATTTAPEQVQRRRSFDAADTTTGPCASTTAAPASHSDTSPRPPSGTRTTTVAVVRSNREESDDVVMGGGGEQSGCSAGGGDTRQIVTTTVVVPCGGGGCGPTDVSCKTPCSVIPPSP
eukprot:GHVS01030843.1.p1 GENE.GHVS01030843.1~~GHVS01030843.1.p1  ORF type:complete len:515 (+),score=59.31 GHVS01030843.1:328-1872(+)